LTVADREGLHKASRHARKRLLQTRFLSWAEASSKTPSGFIGPAGERALYAALIGPTTAGRFALLRDGPGNVSHVLGAPVPGGPLDGAALAVGTTGGIPGAPVHVLFEVKNIRHWIYPQSIELYQLLYKAASVQRANPAHEIVPVLICRRRHFWTLAMGKDLGFFVIEVHDQFVLPTTEITEFEFEEVRQGLGYHTLVRLGEEAPDRLVKSLRDGLLPAVSATSARWRTHGATLLDHFICSGTR
jgi:hypothetical protein